MKDDREHFKKKIAAFTESLRANSLYSGEIKAYPSPAQGGFRGRAKFKVFLKKNGLEVKGTDPRRGETEYKKTLWMLPEWARNMTEAAAAVLLEWYPRARVDGWEMRAAHGRESAVLILSVKRKQKGDYSGLCEEIMNIPAVEGVLISSRKESYGAVHLHHRILEKEFVAPAVSFFQSHLGLTPELIREVRMKTQACRYDRWIDLYCGSGLLALYGAAPRKKIFGLDSDAAAVACARLNAAGFGRNQASFETGRVEDFERFVSPGPGDLVTFDPPRQGIPSDIIRALANSGMRHVCQVSCSPETAVRDLQRWKQSGFQASSVTALDMFPFSRFLETVIFLHNDT